MKKKITCVMCVKQRHEKPHMILNSIFYVIGGVSDK